MRPVLFIFSGLPASGKSSLARLLAREYGAAWLRIDTIEQALRDLCGCEVHGEGYRLAYRIAADNLASGLNVVADLCNPWDLTRREWDEVARESGAGWVNIEVVCSDKCEHKRRTETRASETAGMKFPFWCEVENREYHHWTGDRIVIDTAGKTVGESFEELKTKLAYI